MKQKINVRLIGIAILAVLATLVCMTCVYYSLFQKQVRKDLKIQAQMLGEAEVFDDVSTPAKSFDIAKEDLRITWIDKDGTVLYDNDANTDKLENHADRPEVKSAFLTGDGECVRNSNTMNMTTFYYALLLDNGTVLRVATQARSIWSVFLTAAPMIATILVLIIVICVFLAHLLTGQLLQPIEVMAENMEDTSKVPAYKELVPFVNTIRAQHENILMAAKVRQDFTANVSHELKTPLTAISGYAELIENHMVDPAQETHFAKEIQQNANRLLSLINDIIRLSELDNSENLIHYEQVDLNAIAQECVSNLTVNAEKRGIQLFYEGETCELRADRGMLLELVDNLTANAIRYINEVGEVHLNVLHDNMQPVLMYRITESGFRKISRSVFLSDSTAWTKAVRSRLEAPDLALQS